jgi:hypothetical protein
MSRNKRASQRKKIKKAAFLYTCDGWPLGDCMTEDISEGGAKLALSIADELPPDLLLSFSRDGSVRRYCKVMWRQGDKIGVRFLPAGTPGLGRPMS